MSHATVTREIDPLYRDWITSLKEARVAVRHALLTGTSPHGLPAAQLMARGSMTLFFYTPRGQDRQPPHEQDELYVVTSGSGTFAMGDSEQSMERVPFGPGDAIFAPAGALHRFEDFTEDFATWVIMYGPEGGENPEAPSPAP